MPSYRCLTFTNSVSCVTSVHDLSWLLKGSKSQQKVGNVNKIQYIAVVTCHFTVTVMKQDVLTISYITNIWCYLSCSCLLHICCVCCYCCYSCSDANLWGTLARKYHLVWWSVSCVAAYYYSHQTREYTQVSMPYRLNDNTTATAMKTGITRTQPESNISNCNEHLWYF